MRHRFARRRARPSRARRGFTLVELIVAILVLSIGVLGLAGTAAVVSRQMNSGARQSQAANIAHARFERLAAMSCANANFASGTATTRGITERWVVSGTGNSRVVTDTLTVPGRTGTFVFRSVVYCR